ncbi:MAG: U32 family peptidase [Oscillospiraceae bacterium]|nr:U32 family peptidase [Oscillospiraceae bacterium]
MSSPIILAPAGTQEAVTAAVRCGADAVYLGALNFNARRNAENFDAISLSDTVRFCHQRGTAVYVTVNTLVTDREREELSAVGEEIAASGADAVIIQDMAVMRLFRDRWPDLPRHASTQTAVHDLNGALYLQDQGFQTVVLARELTLREMERICSRLSVKAEAFVHGAHCMSVSGACGLSAVLGGRSGNRGVCAQPCRLDWRCGQGEHVLSLKDMSLLPHVREMAEAGVDIFKIEGRMKRPEYVAAAVTACRQALRGEPWDEEALQGVFSRSGFTDGYLTGRRDKSMFGYRTREDVTGASGVLRPLRALYEKETPRVAVAMDFAMDETGSALTLSDGEHRVTVPGPRPEAALNRPTDLESAQKQLSRTGGTPFFAESFHGEIAPGLILPASALNAMRRQGLDELLERRGDTRIWKKMEVLPAPTNESRDRDKEPQLFARFADPEQIPEGESYERILLPLRAVTPERIRQMGERLCAELPPILWPEDEEALEARLRELKAAGLQEVWGDNIYAIPLARRLGLSLRGGAGLNILNTQALRHYQQEGLLSLTASWELSLREIKALGGTAPLGILAYGRLPLMRFRNCPMRAFAGCADCGGRGELRDRRGVRFPLECGEKKTVTLLNSVPLHIAERDWRGLDFLLLYFTRETRRECASLTEDYRFRRKSAGERTGGLYFRELI